MRMLLFLLFLLFLANSSKSAPKPTELGCLQQMAVDGGLTEADMTTMLVSCSVKQLEGDRIYLSQGDAWRKLRTKLYPRAVEGGEDMSRTELAARTAEITACQMMSSVRREYMRRCLRGGK